MGNARSSGRRSVHAFSMEDDAVSRTRMYTQPLLERHDKRDTAYERRQSTNVARKQLQQDASQEDTRAGADLASVVHQLNSFYAVLWPVCITMVVASLVSVYAADDQMTKAMTTYMYYQNIDSSGKSLGEKSMLALCNALFVIGFIACLTFGIVLLYKFDCMKLFLGYCVFYSASLLALAGTKIVVVVLGQKLHVVFDSVSHWFVMYNFAVVGVLSIFYQKGMPRVVEQGYLVTISVIVAWQLSQLPEWSVWMILLLLGFWDLFAVLTPIGPLRCLVDLVHEKGTPLPGLLYQADVNDSHRGIKPTMAPQTQEIVPTQARMSEDAFVSWLLSSRALTGLTAPMPPPPSQGLGLHHQVVAFLFDQHSSFQFRAFDISQQYAQHQVELWRMLYTYYDVRFVSPAKPYPSAKLVLTTEPPPSLATATPTESSETGDDGQQDRSIRLGLGDFIFYSVLVARAAQHGVAVFAACFLCVICGLGCTMFLLAHYDALPALPLSIFSGILAFLLATELLVPFLTLLQLTTFGSI